MFDIRAGHLIPGYAKHTTIHLKLPQSLGEFPPVHSDRKIGFQAVFAAFGTNQSDSSLFDTGTFHPTDRPWPHNYDLDQDFDECYQSKFDRVFSEPDEMLDHPSGGCHVTHYEDDPGKPGRVDFHPGDNLSALEFSQEAGARIWQIGRHDELAALT